MSGPKVVRIVTREEILSICQGHLHRLDQAMAFWIAEGRRSGELSEEEVAATRERRKALSELIAKDAFMELQKKVPDEIAFLKADLARRQQLAVDRAQQAQKRRRQGRDSAATLLRTLQSRSVEIPADLGKNLNLIASGEEVEHADALLARGFTLLVPENPERPQEVTETQRSLARRLMEGEKEQDFATWKAAHATSPADALLERVDRQIAEAHVFLEADEAAGFAARLRSLEAEPNAARRSLLVDSLVLDLSTAVETRRAQRSAVEELQELASEVRHYKSTDAQALLQRTESCGAATPLKVLAELTEQCKTVLVQEQQRQAAVARRDAILHGLARLGYEVHEGMETAWAKDGRVVVRKPSLPDYGVELGGQAQTSRLQIRAVALSANRDLNRDRDAETIWCGDFGRLQELLAEHGDNLLIERALGVGEVPLKVVVDGKQQAVSGRDQRTFG